MSDAQGTGHRKRILIADDDPILQDIARCSLESETCEVISALDGAAAMHTLLGGAFDLALIDLSMPRIDGFRLIALIRATPPIEDLPIIVITTCDDTESIEEGFRVGANDYLIKPIDWASLPARIDDLLANPGRTAAATPDILQRKRGPSED